VQTQYAGIFNRLLGCQCKREIRAGLIKENTGLWVLLETNGL
jgi:hypothetical protein